MRSRSRTKASCNFLIWLMWWMHAVCIWHYKDINTIHCVSGVVGFYDSWLYYLQVDDERSKKAKDMCNELANPIRMHWSPGLQNRKRKFSPSDECIVAEQHRKKKAGGQGKTQGVVFLVPKGKLRDQLCREGRIKEVPIRRNMTATEVTNMYWWYVSSGVFASKSRQHFEDEHWAKPRWCWGNSCCWKWLSLCRRKHPRHPSRVQKKKIRRPHALNLHSESDTTSSQIFAGEIFNSSSKTPGTFRC